MAKRPYRSFSLLMARIFSPLLVSTLVLSIILTAGILLIFERLKSNQAKKIASTIGTFLRDESSMSRSYLIAQTIEDMHAYDVVTCAKLSLIRDGNITVFYDSTFKPDCAQDSLEKVVLSAIDGNSWEIRLSPTNDLSFNLIKWGTLSLANLVLILAYLALAKVIAREKVKRDLIESKRIFLEELTQQVTHDVASPMSALSIIAARAPLDPDTKNFLIEAVKRTEKIFDSLRQVQRQAEAFSLGRELDLLIREKKTTYARAVAIENLTENFTLRIPATEFKRLLSNLLNNSLEAGATKIEIRAHLSAEKFLIVFSDNGSEFPESVIKKIGLRGNTVGKSSGSGLGLYHAFQLMESIGGELVVSANASEKITLVFPSEIAVRG